MLWRPVAVTVSCIEGPTDSCRDWAALAYEALKMALDFFVPFLLSTCDASDLALPSIGQAYLESCFSLHRAYLAYLGGKTRHACLQAKLGCSCIQGGSCGERSSQGPGPRMEHQQEGAERAGDIQSPLTMLCLTYFWHRLHLVKAFTRCTCVSGLSDGTF